jgi:hypothetical protein
MFGRGHRRRSRRIAIRQSEQVTNANHRQSTSVRGTVSPQSAVTVPDHQLDSAVRCVTGVAITGHHPRPERAACSSVTPL